MTTNDVDDIHAPNAFHVFTPTSVKKLFPVVVFSFYPMQLVYFNTPSSLCALSLGHRAWWRPITHAPSSRAPTPVPRTIPLISHFKWHSRLSKLGKSLVRLKNLGTARKKLGKAYQKLGKHLENTWSGWKDLEQLIKSLEKAWKKLGKKWLRLIKHFQRG